MRRVVLLFVVLLVFASGAVAANFSATKVINGSEFTLLSNTSQCLSNCESWLEWDLTASLTDVQFSDSSNAQFGFELVKASQNMLDLEGFGVEVYEEMRTLVTDRVRQNAKYDFSKADLNGVETCADIGCSDKDIEFCTCDGTEIVETGTHWEKQWIKVSNSIFRFKALKGKVYRLRIWGKRNAGLKENSQDWIPTFFGQRITEWAWWNTDWKIKYPINNMVVSEDQNANNWIVLENIDFSSLLSACDDATDITIVNENTQEEVTDINFASWDGTKTDADLNVLFKLTTGLVADTYNGEYYIYTYNTACAEKTNDTNRQAPYDTFEDGDYTVAPSWLLGSPGVVGTASVQSAITHEGSFALLLDSANGEKTRLVVDTEIVPIYAWAWIRSSEPERVSKVTLSSDGTAEGHICDLQINSDTFFVKGAAAGAIDGVPSADTWYRFAIDFNGTHCRFEIYNSLNALLVIDTRLAAAGTLTSIVLTTEGTGSRVLGYFDEVTFGSPTEITYGLGDQEGSLISLNITTINGESFSTTPIFAFGIDGNITIDFNVFQADNNRLTLDLNYSTAITQGSGTVIVKDLNLIATYCSNQNWNDFPSTCSYSWNISEVVDGNYTINGLIKTTGGLFDFNVSDGNLEIANDVNLIVLVPINEETGLEIDTTVSSFTVRINANGILSTFDGMVDLNGFSVPLGPDFILVEVDTNTPSLFNSRVYAFLFETAQATETLQPFLPPVSASILTTVKTLRFENLKPIPGVRLKVFKDLAGGRTLIHDSITDGKGETTIPFIVADLYEIEVFVDGVLIFTEFYTATATTNEHFIFISSTGEVVFPDELSTPTVTFTPAQKHFNTVDVNLGVIVSTELSNIASIHFVIQNADFNIFDGGLDTGAISDGNTYSVNINDLQDVSDNNFAFISMVIVTLVDGNTFEYSASYSLRPDSDNVLNLLMYDMRTEFGCTIDDLSIRCDGLMFIAFFIVLFVMCAFAVGARGILGGEGLVILGLVLFGFFTFIAWVPLWLYLVMIFAAMGVILTRTRFLGA